MAQEPAIQGLEKPAVSQPDVKTPYTVEDYFDLAADPARELIRGELRRRPAASSESHDGALIALGSLIVGFIRGRSGDNPEEARCGVFVEPVDVVLAADTVVRPDIVVVCDLAKLANGRYVDGAPDLVVEVLTEENADLLRSERRALFEEARVDEFVIVAPAERLVEIYRQSPAGGFAAPERLGPEDLLTFRTLPLLEVRVSEVFGWGVPMDLR